MGTVLVVIEATPEGALRKASLNAVSAALELGKATGSEVHAVALAADAKALAVTGVKVLHAGSSPQFAHPIAENFAGPIAELAKAIGAEYVLGASTSFGRDILPRVAAKLEAAMASDVLAIEGKGADVAFQRPMWAGSVIATVKLATPVKVLSVRSTNFPVSADTSAPEVRELASPSAPPAKTKHVSFAAVKNTRPSLTEASCVVSGGRGTKGNFKPIEELADALGAAIGASRAVCDAGWQPNDLQVGQTGKVVAPKLYIAAGISGAIQHVAGMKGSKTIVAINKDPDAPIFSVADYGLVADLFVVLPELTKAVKGAS